MTFFTRIALLFIVCLSLNTLGQTFFKPEKSKVLFLLDASGSMKQAWGDKTKWEVSIQMLNTLADSFISSNEDLEIGIRVFGHQYPRSEHNCTDTKLEIPFSRPAPNEILNKLRQLTPQGYTPIALSLTEAIKDFQKDSFALKAIILLTDGEEMCEGDVCEAARLLQMSKVVIQPYIIGLNQPNDKSVNFDCAGYYFNAKDSLSLKNVTRQVINEALSSTTAQINLNDINQQPTISNIAFTLYNHYSHQIEYNLIHTLRENGNPDTLWLNPSVLYDLEIHSIPPVMKYKIRLTPGVHNIIEIQMPVGSLKLRMDDGGKAANYTSIVRESYASEALYVQDLNTDELYLRGDFDIDFLSLPRVSKKLVYLQEEKEKVMKLPRPGKVQFVNVDADIASVYEIKMDEYQMLYEFDHIKEKDILELLPGNYVVVFLPKEAAKSDYTKSMYFTVISNKITQVNLR